MNHSEPSALYCVYSTHQLFGAEGEARGASQAGSDVPAQGGAMLGRTPAEQGQEVLVIQLRVRGECKQLDDAMRPLLLYLI